MTRTFTYRLLDFTCTDCRTQARDFNKIAVTDEFELYVEWFCSRCACPKFCVVPLEHIANMKPEPPEPTGEPTTNELAMLHKAGIAWGDDD